MERNYDELFAEMLMQIDRHTEELTKQSGESTKRWNDQHQLNQSMLADLKGIASNMQEISTNMKDMEKVSHQHHEQLVHSATILDRIIRKNHLKV